MSRIEGIERRLNEWAEWKRLDREAASDLVSETDAAIARLPQTLRVTVLQYYASGDAMADHIRVLACPEYTISRRLGQAHRMLAELIRATRESISRECQRVEMRSRLAALDRS